MYSDSHAHLTSEACLPLLPGILERAKEKSINTVVNICTDEASLKEGLALAKREPWIFNTAACTPHDVEKEGESFFLSVEEAARKGELVAIGETGLDYYYEHSNREVQKDFLRRYLRLALEVQLPVVIHCRDAFADFFEILDREYQKDGQHASGVLHCFTGTLEEAKEVIQRGWYLSLSGIVTFKRSEELREVAKLVPLEQLLIETDSPYLAPQAYRGKQNEPAYLPETAALIAELKGLSIQDLAKQTTLNTANFFALSL